VTYEPIACNAVSILPDNYKIKEPRTKTPGREPGVAIRAWVVRFFWGKTRADTTFDELASFGPFATPSHLADSNILSGDLSRQKWVDGILSLCANGVESA
jgi:hypothetical protein